MKSLRITTSLDKRSIIFHSICIRMRSSPSPRLCATPSSWAAAIRITKSGRTKYYGAEDIKSIEVVGQGDLTQNLQFIAPDDGNKDDKTVVDLRLAKPIPNGAFVQFKIAFQTKFPETQARSGWKRDFLLGGQWFPKVGVFWHGAWNCHQYHNTTEFFADFGVYDVKLTVPQYEVIGASGIEVSDVNNPDGTKTRYLPWR